MQTQSQKKKKYKKTTKEKTKTLKQVILTNNYGPFIDAKRRTFFKHNQK